MGFYTYKSKEDWMQKNGFNKEGVTYVITGINCRLMYPIE